MSIGRSLGEGGMQGAQRALRGIGPRSMGMSPSVERVHRCGVSMLFRTVTTGSRQSVKGMLEKYALPQSATSSLSQRIHRLVEGLLFSSRHLARGLGVGAVESAPRMHSNFTAGGNAVEASSLRENASEEEAQPVPFNMAEERLGGAAWLAREYDRVLRLKSSTSWGRDLLRTTKEAIEGPPPARWLESLHSALQETSSDLEHCALHTPHRLFHALESAEALQYQMGSLDSFPDLPIYTETYRDHAPLSLSKRLASQGFLQALLRTRPGPQRDQFLMHAWGGVGRLDATELRYILELLRRDNDFVTYLAVWQQIAALETPTSQEILNDPAILLHYTRAAIKTGGEVYAHVEPLLQTAVEALHDSPIWFSRLLIEQAMLHALKGRELLQNTGGWSGAPMEARELARESYVEAHALASQAFEAEPDLRSAALAARFARRVAFLSSDPQEMDERETQAVLEASAGLLAGAIENSQLKPNPSAARALVECSAHLVGAHPESIPSYLQPLRERVASAMDQSISWLYSQILQELQGANESASMDSLKRSLTRKTPLESVRLVVETSHSLSATAHSMGDLCPPSLRRAADLLHALEENGIHVHATEADPVMLEALQGSLEAMSEHCRQHPHPLMEMSGRVAGVVNLFTGAYPMGGLLPSLQVSESDHRDMQSKVHKPLGELLELREGRSESAYHAATDRIQQLLGGRPWAECRLEEIDDPALANRVMQEITRWTYRVDEWNLEDLHGLGHQEFKRRLEQIEESQGIGAGLLSLQEVRQQSVSAPISLSASESLGVGDCRWCALHHSTLFDAYLNERRAQTTQAFLEAAEGDPERAAALFAQMDQYSKLQPLSLDVEIFAPVELEEGSKWDRVVTEAGVRKKSDSLHAVEDHTLTVLPDMEGGGCTLADAFYQTVYPLGSGRLEILSAEEVSALGCPDFYPGSVVYRGPSIPVRNQAGEIEEQPVYFRVPGWSPKATQRTTPWISAKQLYGVVQSATRQTLGEGVAPPPRRATGVLQGRLRSPHLIARAGAHPHNSPMEQVQQIAKDQAAAQERLRATQREQAARKKAQRKRASSS